MELIVDSLAPLMLLIAVGYLLEKLNISNSEWVDVLNKIAIYILFPSLIFSGITNIKLDAISSFSFVYINSLVLISIIFVTLLITKILKFSRELSNTYIISIFYGNIGYLGFPILHSLMPGYEGVVSIHIAIYTFLLFTLGIAILEISMNRKLNFSILIEALKNPLILSVLLSTAILATGSKLPHIITSSINLLAGGATPIILISLGIFLARNLPKIDYTHTIALVVIKLIIMPLLFYSLYLALEKPNILGVSVLEAGMPIAITPYILAQIYPLKGELIAVSIVASCMFALLTLPTLMVLIGAA